MGEILLFTEDVMKDMGKRIQIERRKKGFKAIDFADIIGIGKDQLSRIENGKVPCKVEYIFVIAQILQVSVDYIMFGKMGIDDDVEYLLSTISDVKRKKIEKIMKILIEE